MKKKSAIIALLLAGAMSFGVMSASACKKHENDNNDNNNTVVTPGGDNPGGDNPGGDNPGGEDNPGNPSVGSVTVTYVNDGVTVSSRSVESGTVDVPPTVTKDGHYFGGWYENPECTGNAYDFTKAISKAHTFYVKWVKLNSAITLSQSGYESAAFEWKDTNAAGASVKYKLSTEQDYKQVDKELVRTVDGGTVRADVLGLKGGASYDFVITTSAGTPMDVAGMKINAYDRSGYAHFNYSDGVGAYNDDGTLKDNALVIYVTDKNKDSVMDEVCAANSDVPMFKIPGSDWGGKNASGIGWWLNNNQYTSSNAGSKKNKQPSNTYDQANGGKLSFKSVNRPVVIRFIGSVTTPEGCTAYDSTKEGGGVGDNGHMARLKNLKNITLEGVGEDAVIQGWGFHFVIGTDATGGQGKSFEVRNLTFNEYPEDAIGMEGQQSGGKITAGVERCWIHNNTFLPGRCDNPAESDKAEGDGSCDFKRGQYFTCSYNYFEYCHKTNLVGSADDSLQYNLTYHHNMWYQCGSRIPLTRQANVHFYNNFVCYDANEKTTPYEHISKPAGSYVHSLRANCYIFSEGNYYEGSKNVTDGKSGGSAKGWNNMYYANFGTNTIEDAATREQKVDNKCAYNGTDYSSFDINPTLFYYDAQNKRSNCYLTDAATARREVLENVGVMGFTPKVSVEMFSEKPSAALSIPESGLNVDLSKIANNTAVSGVQFYNAKTNSGVVKGRGLVAAFTIADRTDIKLSSTGGDTGCELLRADGAVIAGKITTFTGTLEAGTYYITTGQKDKDGSLTELSFKQGVTDAEKVANVEAAISAIGEVTLTAECKNKIDAAKALYNALGDSLKKNVNNSATLTAAVTAYNTLAAAPVVELINDIGTVGVDSGEKISSARTAYNALTAEQKALVTNYAKLTAAEAEYEKYEVEGINNTIAALPAPSTATTEEAIRELLERYETVNVMYGDLDEDQKAEVKGYDKVTSGIAALEKAVAPYEVKQMIADLPEETASDYFVKVKALKAAYEALDAGGKALITGDDKTAYDAAVAKYIEYASKAKVAIFVKNKPELATDAGFTVNGTGYKGTSQVFTYNGKEYDSPLKMESKTSVTFSTETEMKVTILLMTEKSDTINIDGQVYKADSDGIIVIDSLASGSHTIVRDSSETWLCYVELTPAL